MTPGTGRAHTGKPLRDKLDAAAQAAADIL